MAAIITEKFRIHNAKQFKEDFGESASSSYIFIGRPYPWADDTSPPSPANAVGEEIDSYSDMLALKKWDIEYFKKNFNNVILPIEKYSNGFLGINIHYLSMPMRLRLLDRLVDYSNNDKFDISTKLNVDYSKLKKIDLIRINFIC